MLNYRRVSSNSEFWDTDTFLNNPKVGSNQQIHGDIYIYIDGTYITNIKLISFEELGRWRCDHSVWLTGMGTGCRSLEDLGIFRETRLKTHKSNTQNKCMDYDSGWWFQTWILFSIMYIYIYIHMGCHPSHCFSYFSRWLKPPTRIPFLKHKNVCIPSLVLGGARNCFWGWVCGGYL